MTQLTPFLARLLKALGPERFTLLDIGCSGGISQTWFTFGDHLQAYGFDPNVEDVARLNAAAARQPGKAEYIAAFVGLEPGHPFHEERRRAGLHLGNTWDRLAVAHSQEIRRRAEGLSHQQRTEQNYWADVKQADPAKPIYIPQFLRERVIDDVDFIKLDIDGYDYDILHSLEPVLASHRVIGFQMEVNFYGTADPAAHTFHNTDRFLRQAGFELIDLSTTRYSLAALPSRYLFKFPAQAAKGRLFQGDAFYVRDLAWTAKAPLPEGFTVAKLIKLAALFALRGFEDHAAEVLVVHRALLEGIVDINAALNELAAAAMQEAGIMGEPLTYRRYIELFEADDPRFYQQPPTMAQSAAKRLMLALKGAG